jgi:hypothetical protein
MDIDEEEDDQVQSSAISKTLSTTVDAAEVDQPKKILAAPIVDEDANKIWEAMKRGKMLSEGQGTKRSIQDVLRGVGYYCLNCLSSRCFDF